MTKKISILAGLSVSAMFFAQDVSTIRNTTEAYDNSPLTGSARYSAMAGAMGALGGDLSSINTNPAGLGVYITNDSNVGLMMTSNSATSSLAGKSIKKSIDNTSFHQAGGVLSFQTSENSEWKFINVGLNYSSENINTTIQSSENINIREPYGTSDYNVFSGHLSERVGTKSKFNIGIGANYNNRIYIGAGIHFASVDLEQFDEIKISSFNTPSQFGYFKRQNTPFREEVGGFGLSLGVIGKINNQFRLGASFESPTWYSVDREYTYYIPENPNEFDTEVATYSAVENRSLRTPSKLTLSGAFIPNKSFALNVDYRVDLGKPKFSGGATEDQLNDFYQSKYNAQHQVRIGGEYRVKGFRVRGGYAFTTSPFKNYSYDENNFGVFNTDGSVSTSGKISNYIVGKNQIISGGLGYDFKSFYVDFAYQNITQKYNNPFFDGSYFHTGGNYNYSQNSIVSDVKTQRNNFILTLGWKF